MSDATETIRAYVYLLNVVEPPAVATHAFVVANGAVGAARRIRAGQLPATVEREVKRREVSVDHDIEVIESGAARLITPHDAEWPAGVLAPLTGELPWMCPPLALWVRGSASLRQLTQRAVSIVGSRGASPYGELVASAFGRELAEHQVATISGALYGIEGAAHRGALTISGGHTVAVLGCGVDVSYPSRHSRLLEQIVDSGGLIVSEYPRGSPPARRRWSARSRLIAALGASTVVVEAARRSDSLHAAHMATMLGRRLLAVPGPITSSQSVSTNELLRAGLAQAVTSAAEVMESSRLDGSAPEHRA